MKPAAAYFRVSTDMQKHSIEAQRVAIEDYARREGFEIVASYEDAGRSGVTVAHRDGLKALMRDVMGEHRFTTILVTDVSRWGRYQDPDEAAHYEFLCRSAGVDVRYCAEGFEDDGSPASSLMKAMKRAMAAEYSRQLSDRVRVGKRRAMLAGGRNGGRPPYGFAREAFGADGTTIRLLGPGERAGQGTRVRLVPGPPAQVAVLKRIFRMFVSEVRGAAEIAQFLNAEGVPYSHGGAWHTERVKAVLTNEAAIGVSAFDRTHWRFGQQTGQVPKAEWMRVKTMRPLVSAALFAKAQARLKKAAKLRLTDDELLERLRRLLKAQGFLSRRTIQESSLTGSMTTYDRRFGSLQAAYDRVGYVRSVRNRDHVHASKMAWDHVEAALTRLLTRHGYLSLRLIDASGDLPCSEVLRRNFGPIEEIYRRVGYEATRSERLAEAWKHRKRRAAEARARGPRGGSGGGGRKTGSPHPG